MLIMVSGDELRKALADIEAAEANGFMYCQAIFDAGRVVDGCNLTLKYSDMSERAHPTDGRFNWGRCQGVSRRNKFVDGKLVPIVEHTMKVGQKQSKYRAVPTVIDGIRFASKKEARRYGELKLLEKAGHIARLELQRPFELVAPRTGIHGDSIIGGWRNRIGCYVADFCYDELSQEATRFVVEDTKGFRTPLYKWKKKHVEAQYGIQIREV